MTSWSVPTYIYPLVRSHSKAIDLYQPNICTRGLYHLKALLFDPWIIQSQTLITSLTNDVTAQVYHCNVRKSRRLY